MTDAWQAEHPCFVLAPQCPEEQCWVPYVDLLAQSLLEMAAVSYTHLTLPTT